VPIYEFTCRACAHEFETLLRGAETANCPRCSSVELHKKLSLFASQKQAPDAAATACGTCGHPGGPGSRAIN
jgi:putative FmdB family regulatory protein